MVLYAMCRVFVMFLFLTPALGMIVACILCDAFVSQYMHTDPHFGKHLGPSGTVKTRINEKLSEMKCMRLDLVSSKMRETLYVNNSIVRC